MELLMRKLRCIENAPELCTLLGNKVTETSSRADSAPTDIGLLFSFKICYDFSMLASVIIYCQRNLETI